MNKDKNKKRGLKCLIIKYKNNLNEKRKKKIIKNIMNLNLYKFNMNLYLLIKEN